MAQVISSGESTWDPCQDNKPDQDSSIASILSLGDSSGSVSDSDSCIVWKKGGYCLATFSGDDQSYKAKIRRIFKNDAGRMMALVSYEGYDSDCDEEQCCSALRPIVTKKKRRNAKQSKLPRASSQTSNIGMFSPLQGNEDSERLNNKFQALEQEEKIAHNNTTLQNTWNTTDKKLLDRLASPSTPRRKRKSQVAIGGGTKGSGVVKKPLVSPGDSNKPLCVLTKTRVRQHTGLTSDSESESENKTNEGFEFEEFEKPRFPHVTTSSCEPLILSEKDATSIIQVPGTINRYLRDYQRDGVCFLYKHYTAGRGAILGDDMGLGKTVQVISFIAAVLQKTGTKHDVMRKKPSFIRKMSDNYHSYEDSEAKLPFLIIGPASILYNWLDEFDTWGHFSVGLYHKNLKEKTLSELKRGKLDVAVTTFETCRDNIDTLNDIEWAAVFADEAHKIKNMKAEVTVSLRRLRCKCRYGLTGTPLQNNLQEMWCLLDWVRQRVDRLTFCRANPGCMGALKDFQTKYSKKIECGQKRDATKRELAECRKAQDELSQYRAKWMIRRKKSIIADQLPVKEENVVFCKPTCLQTDIYKNILAQDDIKYILTQYNPCECESGLTKGRCCHKETPSGDGVHSLTLTYQHLLLKAANHIALLLPHLTQSEKQHKHSKRICQQVFEKHQQFVKQTQEASFRTLSDPKYCGKMKVLQGILSVFNKQRAKVLLFSYSTKLLDIVENHVMSTGYEYRRLDGTTPEKKRVTLVHEFNKDPNIFLFLASTKAGGVGLNLTGANVVVIYDPNWNPTHDLQAQDRAYRIGQQRNVRVFRLISSGTIEENIYLRQIYKQQLEKVAVSSANAKRFFEGVQGDSKQKGELFGVENMFSMRTGDRCLTEDILKRNDKIEAGLRAFNVVPYIALPATCDTTADGEGRTVVDKTVSSVSEGETSTDSSTGDEHDALDLSDERSASLHDSTSCADAICSEIFGFDFSDEDDAQKKRRQRAAARNKRKQRNCRRFDNVDSPDRSCSVESGSDSVTGARNNTRRTSEACDNPKPSTSGYKPSSTELRERNRTTKNSVRNRNRKTRRLVLTDESSDDDNDVGVKTDRGASMIESHGESLASVTDVFAECGVVHTHRNQSVVGDSRAENHMSRCAVQDVYELHQYSQMPAINCDIPLSESEEETEEDEAPKKSNKKKAPKRRKTTSQKKKVVKKRKPNEGPRMKVVSGKKILVGQTPKAIKRKHFQSIAKWSGFDDISDFALDILKKSKRERKSVLSDYYSNQDDDLKNIFSESSQSGGECVKETEKTRRSKGKLGKKTILPKKKKKCKPKKGCKYSTDSDDTEHETDGGRMDTTINSDGTDPSTSTGVTSFSDRMKSPCNKVSVHMSPQKHSNSPYTKSSKHKANTSTRDHDVIPPNRLSGHTHNASPGYHSKSPSKTMSDHKANSTAQDHSVEGSSDLHILDDIFFEDNVRTKSVPARKDRRKTASPSNNSELSKIEASDDIDVLLHLL